jgi:hypothetical protein
MNMRIRIEKEYCNDIIRVEPDQFCVQVADWSNIAELYNAYRPAASLAKSKASSTVITSLTSGYQALSKSDRSRKNFLSGNANTLADFFIAGKKIQKHNRLSGSKSYRIAQRHVDLQNRMFDLKIVN